jgi:DNA-binding response OmpR family regulator
VIDDECKLVTVDGEEVKLTPVQYKILKLLTANAGRVFSIDDIYEKVWNEAAYSAENTVAVHIRRIREKLKSTRKNQIFEGGVGIGYKVEKI